MRPKYQEATDYVFINALSKVCSIKLPYDKFEEAIDLAFSEFKQFRVPDYFYLTPIKTRYPCVADFTSKDFKKTELFDVMTSQPKNYFLLIDAFASGADALYFAFNKNYMEELTSKKNINNQLVITRTIDGETKQLISASTLHF